MPENELPQLWWVTCTSHQLALNISLIDRPQSYLVVIATGLAPVGPDVFVEPLAHAHTELTTAFDVFIVKKRWNAIFADGGVGTDPVNTAQ